MDKTGKLTKEELEELECAVKYRGPMPINLATVSFLACSIKDLLSHITALEGEVERASKHVDIEIVKAQGLDVAIEVLRGERDRLWEERDALKQKVEGLEKKYTQTVARWQIRAEGAEKGEAQEIHKRVKLQAQIESVKKVALSITDNLEGDNRSHGYLVDDRDKVQIYVGDIRRLRQACTEGENND